MTKEEFVRLFAKAEEGRMDMLKQGVSYMFIVKEGDAYMVTGIGDGADLSMITLQMIHSIYMQAAGVSLETFADSVRDTFVRAVEDGVFKGMQGSI